VRTAIAAQDECVAPRLDQAPRLVVIDSDASVAEPVESIDIRQWPAHGRAYRLTLLNIDALICRGVSSFDQAGFDANGVRLIDGVSGPIAAVVTAVQLGTIAAGHSYWSQAPGETLP
jgi:predicted Fe-Mo cluster-binding NifX family protein